MIDVDLQRLFDISAYGIMLGFTLVLTAFFLPYPIRFLVNYIRNL